MTPPSIRAKGLGKRYRLRQTGASYDTLRDALNRIVTHPFRNDRSRRDEFFWALRDVDFEVQPGEVLGIIGRNGAGKSTLLKILSNITDPTTGIAELRGRVGSLLEVGSGFHTELTGRENIFLNGAILGMKRAEILRQFDEIVDFAEVGAFLDMPVKQYSSGMYSRLAFAVAAHLQSEILLLDEVLAVGDIEFQRRCIGRMEEIARDGRTVILVSHTMSVVRALASHAILLEKGTMRRFGPADAVVAAYLEGESAHGGSERVLTDADCVLSTGEISVRRIRLKNAVAGRFAVHWRQRMHFEFEIDVSSRLAEVSFGAGIRAVDNTMVFIVHHDDEGTGRSPWNFEPGRYEVRFSLGNDLRPGLYYLEFGAHKQRLMDRNLFVMRAATIEVLDFAEGGDVPSGANPGIINGDSSWEPPERLI